MERDTARPADRKAVGRPASLAVSAAAALCLASCLFGCERVREVVERIASAVRSPARRSQAMADTERIVRKFGQPRQKVGMGKAGHTEHGIRYNRKWYYYYSSMGSPKPTVRTVYFMDDRFAGSVIQRPDGTIHKEEIKFPY